MRNFMETLLLGGPSKADFRDFLAQCKEFARQLPCPKGQGLFETAAPQVLQGSALLSLSGVSGVFVTTTPPRKATAAFLIFIAAL